MQTLFGIVIFSVVGVSGLIAIAAFLFGGQPPHSTIGGNGFAPPPPPGSEPAELREDDVRQMLEARNRRRLARGEPGGDVEAELAALLSSTESAASSGEAREEAEAIVSARQARRRRRGRPEGDFEAEVEELLRTLDAG